jgi:hypothetical protein
VSSSDRPARRDYYTGNAGQWLVRVSAIDGLAPGSYVDLVRVNGSILVIETVQGDEAGCASDDLRIERRDADRVNLYCRGEFLVGLEKAEDPAPVPVPGEWLRRKLGRPSAPPLPIVSLESLLPVADRQMTLQNP